MKIVSFHIKNYRRLFDIDLALYDKKTILVGANNSGKTSCIGALHTFLARPENLRIRDVSKQHWKSISDIGARLEVKEITTEDLVTLSERLAGLLPCLDLVITADASEAYKARDILPHLGWRGGPLGVRIAYEPENMAALAADFKQARSVVAGHSGASLWPKNLFEFLEKGRNFNKYINLKHYILGVEAHYARDDEKPSEAEEKAEILEAVKDAGQVEGQAPQLQPLPSGALKKLIRVDVISEQRGLGIEDSSDPRGPYSEKQQLNKLLRDYYERFLNPEDFPEAGDLEVLAKQQEMERSFTRRLEQQFRAPLDELEQMGYPGIGGNPSVEIAAKVSGADALQRPSSVRYRFDKDQDDSLPESYLGLGYQNLIYLTFRLLGFREKWMRTGKSVSSDGELNAQIEPIHLVLVEEPEVNLHAQVQRVFIAKAYETLRKHPMLGANTEFQTQLVVSTHSSHIVNDVDFKDLRYFRRSSANDEIKMDHSSVENMSDLFADEKNELKFVSKHLKLTHCDIFFADGVIFVEGQAERLLVPEFIARNFKDLSKRYLSILEVSGAHTHKYKALVEKLGIITLIITDLDTLDTGGKKCAPKLQQSQITNNYTLINWHPKHSSVDDLVNLSKEDCDTKKGKTSALFVAFQKKIKINGTEVLSRTFEDSLILANFDKPYFQNIPQIKEAKEAFNSNTKPLEISLFNYVQKLTKGDFAFSCLFYISEDAENSFKTPPYISEGLEWLQTQLSPGL
ncbi:AAA family ATPase [Mariluticola halotolerans]|uniref:AAA family ATPase n=1 Tax=Mariluticola halotolerans TaxID=2909283 RepID=UPI0026E3822C|nr:AAA family ATPase [Mariluticola halotolerans]UJQ95552.1 AAA family ATPase [Mariluticola halotolerans]